MSKSYRVFIDGQAGTTGLQIADRLKNHDGVTVVEIDPADRKDAEKKKQLMASVDLTFLCLPDDAAIEAAAMAKEVGCRVIDASTAHRTKDGWVYGMAELAPGQRDKIAAAQCVANPGCYPTGALLTAAPLLRAGVLAPNTQMHFTGYSGYSGGGNQMIDAYENQGEASACALYGLNFSHKHVPEIFKWSGLTQRPSFIPSVVNVAQGMFVTTMIYRDQLTCDFDQVANILRDAYKNESCVVWNEDSLNFDGRFQFIEGLANTNLCEISMFANAEHGQALLVAKLDNLGKGASGAAVQNMNIMLDLPEDQGINLA